MDEMYQKYGGDVSFEYYTPEAVYRVASEKKGLDVGDIIAEFELEERNDYWARSNAVRTAALAARADALKKAKKP
jgi:hypothetical protein